MVICLLCAYITGCNKHTSLNQPYSDFLFQTENNKVNLGDFESSMNYLASGLCVTDQDNILVDQIGNTYVGAGAIFDITNKDVVYAYNLFERRYPASMTKVLTAYITLKYCELDEKVIVGPNAVDMPDGAVTCGIQAGDVLRVKDLLYALLLVSANDAAIALAEHISGSVEAFAELMNKEARLMGATHTHFVNPHGLHDDDHYTTVYDMYLMFHQAIQSEMFCKIINTQSYTATYKSVGGAEVQKTYSTSNKFLNGEKTYPDNFEVIGGKTGTTFNAGKCLILYVSDDLGSKYILVAFGCDSRDILYDYLSRQMMFINEIR